MRSVVTYCLRKSKGRGDHCDMYIPHVLTYSPLCTVLHCAGSTLIPRSMFAGNSKEKGQFGGLSSNQRATKDPHMRC